MGEERDLANIQPMKYLGLTKISKNAIGNFIHQLALKSFLHE